ETIVNGAPSTEFMKFGDVVEIEMFDEAGDSLFGKIRQKVTQYTGP
ncbi:MAG: 2-keto-4-pentenoate hydratase, partial [Pseudomonadota bacterium]